MEESFFKKCIYTIINFILMLAFIVACVIATSYYLKDYTRHGEEVVVPNVKGLTVNQAISAMDNADLLCSVTDSVYIKTMPTGVIYEQSIYAGCKIKSGRTVLLTINSNTPPKLVFPDIADNSSLREAKMKLKAQGFKTGPEKYIPGEKDWVYEVQVNGKTVTAGSRIGVEETITLIVGDGSLYTDEYGNEILPDSMSLEDPNFP